MLRTTIMEEQVIMYNINNEDKYMLNQPIKPYKKDAVYSYTLGAFPTYELIISRPQEVIKVIAHSGYTDMSNLAKLCEGHNIPLEQNDKALAKISDKENCYVAGVFRKYDCILSKDKPHIVLVNPSNMGNLGTILRTALGFGIKDIGIILPGTDIYNPKTVRASMGALFKINHQSFATFSDYKMEYDNHEIFTFMLNGEHTLSINDCPKSELFTLVFGNEATGLDASYLTIGNSIIIPQSDDVDSLNLTIAVGIGAYMFTNRLKA